MSTISSQTALVYVMVIAALADGELKDSELHDIAETVKTLPVFHGFDGNKLKLVVGDCVSMLDQEDGIDAVLGLVKEALPEKFKDTAYALACDIVAVDGSLATEELEWLKLLRDGLHVSELHAAAIECAAHARYMRHPVES